MSSYHNCFLLTGLDFNLDSIRYSHFLLGSLLKNSTVIQPNLAAIKLFTSLILVRDKHCMLKNLRCVIFQ